VRVVAAGMSIALIIGAPSQAQTIGGLQRGRPVARLHAQRLAPFYPLPEWAEPRPTETLADAIALAYRANPILQARRYDLQATDEGLGLALSELRPTTQIQIAGQYDKTVPGRTTQATRFSRSSIITGNTLSGQIVLDQPLYTGGRASADIAAASADIRAGRALLRATEGDLLLQTITAYLDVRRDTRALGIRTRNLAQLRATLAEVVARREAGELTRTDVAQAETQLGNAETQFNLTREQLEQSRAAYAALVGVDPGVLAPEPPLPQLPASIDIAFDEAAQRNPELAQARFAEVASRQRIIAARALERPTVSLRATAGLNGQGAPFLLRNEDQRFTAQTVLTVPLTAGGRAGAQTAQASATNSADRLRIEAARRAMVRSVADSWNQMVTAGRNVKVAEAQLASARIYYEGTFEEYRAGLRSTFDVLFAQGSLRDTEIGLLSARHDLYVAQASLLRRMGVLEVANITTGVGLYDPTANVRRVEARGSLPWDPLFRAMDRGDRPRADTKAIVQPLPLPVPAAIVGPVGPPPTGDYATEHPNVAIPGTTGRPAAVGPR
jgi:outer membrane protein